MNNNAIFCLSFEYLAKFKNYMLETAEKADN